MPRPTSSRTVQPLPGLLAAGGRGAAPISHGSGPAYAPAAPPAAGGKAQDARAEDGGCRPGASLAWVLTTDGLQHVSTWAHLSPRDRPRNTATAPGAVTCPVCERPVVLKLGRKVVHHAAHAPGDPCVVTQPETALHFNLKCHIAAQLAAAVGTGRPLRVTEACMVGQSGLAWERRYHAPAPADYLRHEWLADPCEERRERVWLEAWDRVELERRVGDERAARIPDVVLYRSGIVVGAIEVFHSHAVDDAKAETLAALEVPWVEVRADEALFATESAWTLDAPLPAYRIGPAGRWRCATHEGARRAMLEAEVREREAARHTRRVCAVKLVDVLYPSGKSFRNVYSVVELNTDGVPHAVALERSGDALLTLPYGSAPKAALWARLQERCAADIFAVEQRRGARTDSPMAWATGALAERIVARLAAGLWRRVPLERTHPLRWRFAPRRSQWFLPADLRDVSWDRPADDPLEESHPAWRRPPPPRPSTAGPEGTSAAPVSRGSAPARWRTPLKVRDLGAAVEDVEEVAAVSVYALRRRTEAPERVVVVPRGEPSREDVRRVDDALRASGVERLWVSHRGAWPAGLDEVPWLPLVAAPDGGHAVPVTGVAMPVADAVAAFAAGTPALAPATIVARRLAMAHRG